MSWVPHTLLQKLAESRCEEALILYSHHKYSGAYYLAGYAFELSIKAILAKRVPGQCLPDMHFAKNVFKHDLSELIALAMLKQKLNEHIQADKKFQSYWSIVNEWKVDSCYDSQDQFTATGMINAIMDQNSGVYPWLKTFW